MKTKCIHFVLFFLVAMTSFSQSGKMFTVDKELSSSMVNKVYQDQQGIIWIATDDGLNRYDGAKFTVYRHLSGEENSLVNNHVRVMAEDSAAALLIGTQSGLQKYNAATDQFSSVSLRLPLGESLSANISALLKRKGGDFWVGTSGHGLFLLSRDGSQCEARQMEEWNQSYLITDLYEDREENVWISTEDNGLFCKTKEGEVKHYFNGPGMKWGTISCVREDAHGGLYVGTLRQGLFRYDTAKGGFQSVPYPSNPNLSIKSLYPAEGSKLYIGTEGSGLLRYDAAIGEIEQGQFSSFLFDLNKAKVHSILQDRSGNWWFGIFQKGVLLLPATTNAFGYWGYKSLNGNLIGSNCVMSICRDNAGTLWVGTDNDGLYSIGMQGDRKRHDVHTLGANSVPSTIMAICEDSNGTMWLGGYLSGMAKYDRATGRCQYVQNLVDGQSVFCFAEDGEKGLWIGTMGGGLYRMDLRTESIMRCRTREEIQGEDSGDNYLHNRWVNCLLYSKKNKLYIGTYDGLSCLDIKEMDFASTFKRNRLFGGMVIHALCEDELGGLWIGGSEGLVHLIPESEQITRYGVKDGLPAEAISGIEMDNEGNLWISTNGGLSKFDRKTYSFSNFFTNDGLQGNEFSKGVALKGSDGRLYFGGVNGITYFNPSDIVASHKLPKVYITDFHLHDKAVRKGTLSGGDPIIDVSVMEANRYNLSYRDNSFTIEFSTMEFNNPERISFSYTINSRGPTLLNPGVNRVSFSDLNPGSYVLAIRAKDDGVWSEERVVTIVIAPAWYASNSAWAVYFLLLLLISYVIVMQVRYRFRMHRKMSEHRRREEINEAKLQFFINISHEIRTPMTLIMSPLRKLMAGEGDMKRLKSFQIIHRNADRILSLVNQLMDVRKIDKGLMLLKFRENDLVQLLIDICAGFEYQMEHKGIVMQLHTDLEELPVWIDPNHFDKIILNLLSNALKFTPEGGHVDLYVTTKEVVAATGKLHTFAEIVVADSGPGIEEHERQRIFDRFYQIDNSVHTTMEGSGIGLHLTRSLVELHHGEIQVDNNPDGTGSRFIVSLPLGCEHLQPEEQFEETVVSSQSDTMISMSTEVSGEEERSKSKTKHRVLLVEDNEEIARYVCDELSNDFHMCHALNGREALALILKSVPTLVISDVMMPEMDGITLCRKIKQNVNINHLPVVLLTAKAEEEDYLRGLSVGADAYIAKPFSIEILRSTVENMIRGRMLLRNCYLGHQEQECNKPIFDMQSTDNKLLDKIMNVINRNIANEDLSVEMIAMQVGISRVHLHRKLKELTNQSTRDLIRNVRLKYAARLLLTKQNNVSEVAELTGFTSISTFSRAFKDLYGVSPSDYHGDNNS